MKDIAIYGAGGFGKEVACLIRMINQKETIWNFIGFFDDDANLKGTRTEYGDVLGDMESLNNYDKPLSLVLAIGNPDSLKEIVSKITNNCIDYPNLIAPTTIFLDKERITFGKGNIVCSRCLFSFNVEIGDFNVFNGYIPCGHDTKMGSYNVIMPSVNISGGVHVGDCNFLGVQSVVLQNVKIGNNTRIGANSVVMRKTKDGYLYIGNPAQRATL